MDRDACASLRSLDWLAHSRYSPLEPSHFRCLGRRTCCWRESGEFPKAPRIQAADHQDQFRSQLVQLVLCLPHIPPPCRTPSIDVFLRSMAAYVRFECRAWNILQRPSRCIYTIRPIYTFRTGMVSSVQSGKKHQRNGVPNEWESEWRSLRLIAR
jgi:hypothetical protein